MNFAHRCEMLQLTEVSARYAKMGLQCCSYLSWHNWKINKYFSYKHML